MIAHNGRLADHLEPIETSGDIGRILVISASGLGDTLLATPLFAALRRQYGSARIDLFTMFESAAAVARATGHFDEVVCHDLMGGDPARTARVLLALRRRRYDLSVLTFSSNRGHYNILSRLIGARVRAGHSYLVGSDLAYGRFLLTHRVEQTPATHAVEENLKLARLVGCRPRSFRLDIGRFGEAEGAWAADRLVARTGPLVGIHPGCDVRKNHAHRRWPVERYEELLARLHGEAGATGLVILGPTESDLAARFTACGDHVAVVQGESIERVAAALHRCDLFVSADSGIGHLAAACGVPSVQVLGPTNPDYIRPWGVAHQVVRRGTSCSPCFEYSRHPLRCQQAQPYRCLSGLGVDEVLAACLGVLGDRGRPGRERELPPTVQHAVGVSGCALGLNAEAPA